MLGVELMYEGINKYPLLDPMIRDYSKKAKYWCAPSLKKFFPPLSCDEDCFYDDSGNLLDDFKSFQQLQKRVKSSQAESINNKFCLKTNAVEDNVFDSSVG